MLEFGILKLNTLSLLFYQASYSVFWVRSNNKFEIIHIDDKDNPCGWFLVQIVNEHLQLVYNPILCFIMLGIMSFKKDCKTGNDFCGIRIL
jgi:hypothetical protein